MKSKESSNENEQITHIVQEFPGRYTDVLHVTRDKNGIHF